MTVRQNVHEYILKLSQELSAENGDNFRNEALEIRKIEILSIF
jgi:hypothetical protein